MSDQYPIRLPSETVLEQGVALRLNYRLPVPGEALIQRPDEGVLEVTIPCPLLSGKGVEAWTLDGEWRQDRGWWIHESSETLLLVTRISAMHHLSHGIETVYRELFDLTQGWHLHRIWNYLPKINEEIHGLERYRHFNLGRWNAFEGAFGDEFPIRLPAASGVGCEGEDYVMVCRAGKVQPELHENPLQSPAWLYPEFHGPKAPGFARGGCVTEHGKKTFYLSGTASIRGHESLVSEGLTQQLAVTWENILKMREIMGVETLPDQSEASHEFWKVYLRRPSQLEEVQSWLKARIAGQIMIVRSDICRAELDVEIEGVF